MINGISDGGTYCISGEFTVSEKNLKEVQVDGVPATARSAVYTLNPGGHTVTVIDKADNRTQIKVNVNEKHTPEEDDGDCTTAVKCSVCGKVLIQAQEQHDYTYTSNGDGTHTIGCTRCSYSEVEDCAGGTDCKYEKDAVPLVPDNDKTESGEALQTGDDSNYILWIVLLAMSGVSIIGTAIYRRKRKDN